MKCSVNRCKQNNSKKTTVSFYNFPKNAAQRKLWVMFCKRNIDVRKDKICALHFKQEDFERNLVFEMGFSNRRAPKLKPGAVPSMESTIQNEIKIPNQFEIQNQIEIPNTPKATDIKEDSREMYINTLEMQINVYQNYKCGEIFCISPEVFDVTCCMCASKMHLDQFPSHFQIQHLRLLQQSINLEELEIKSEDNLAKDANLLDNMILKEEDPEDDPIKQEEFVSDEDDKSLQQLMRENAKARLNHTEEEQSDMGHIDFENKLEVAIVVKKPNNRNSGRVKYKEDILDDNNEIEKVLGANVKDTKEDNEEVEVDLNKDECEEEDNDDMDIDKDWAKDGKTSDIRSVDKTYSTTDELPFRCLICKRSYSNKISLQKHNNHYHNLNKPRKPKPKAEHKCDECGKENQTISSTDTTDKMPNTTEVGGSAEVVNLMEQYKVFTTPFQVVIQKT